MHCDTFSVFFDEALVEVAEEGEEQAAFAIVFGWDEFVKAFFTEALNQDLSACHFEAGFLQVVLVEEFRGKCTEVATW